MGVPTIAFYATQPRNIYPTAFTPHDFESTTRLSSSPPSTAASASLLQKPMVGGLSCIFSSSALRHATGGEELGSLGHERGEDLSSSFCCSARQSIGSCSLKRDQSPVSVLQAPLSCSSNGVQGSAVIRVVASPLLNGFVRNALESCIEYDSSSFQIRGGEEGVASSPSPVEELPFNMDYDDDDNTEAFIDSYAEVLLTSAQSRHKIFSEDFVLKAFFEAEKAHRGQMRANGDTYLKHCVETAVLLALIGASSTVVAAGLLHDTLDDSLTSYDYILQTFGSGVSSLVEGVSKLSQLSKLARENNTANKAIEADRLHTIFLAMADARAVLIKLADRLHNMITLDALPMAKQQRFAKETLEIFTPLANRLGIFSWKVQLENLCFKHLYPDQHRELYSKLEDSFDEEMVTTAIKKLDCGLNESAISYHFLSGRHKSLYSIYRKMLRKKLCMDEIHDIQGLRLIVENEDDCYKALRIVHELWCEVPGKLKDYINRPKFNGYQSLHTVVMGEGMVPFEVQIRTKEMHMQAEFGIAAHWRYKERDCRHSAFVVKMVEWARWVVTWQCEAMSKYNHEASIIHGDSIKPPCAFPSHSNGCPYTYKPLCSNDGPIFVIAIETDKMWVQEFGVGATIMDLMERVGRGRGDRFPSKKELRPRVNQKAVSDPMYELQMGDVVELSPAIPHHSLTEYREEIQRMYEHGLTVSTLIS